MEQPINSPDMSDQSSFGMAASHFITPAPTQEELDGVWGLMAKQSVSATDVADRLESATTADADNWLSWCVEQDILVNTSPVHTMYARPEFAAKRENESPLIGGSLAARTARYIGLSLGLIFLIVVIVMLTWMVYAQTFGVAAPSNQLPEVVVGTWLAVVLVDAGLLYAAWLLGRSLAEALRTEWDRSRERDRG